MQRMLADSPHALWPLQDGPGDVSGNGRHLTATGGPTYGVAGPLGLKAASLNGTSQSWSRAGVDLSGTNKVTVAYLLRPDSWAGGGGYNILSELTADGGANTGGFNNYQSSSVSAIEVNSKDASVLHGDRFPRPAIGSWYFFHAVLDKAKGDESELTFYQDGVALTRTHVTGTSLGGNFANSTLYIGARANSSLWFHGAMAYVGLYASALTAAQISEQVKVYRRSGVSY